MNGPLLPGLSRERSRPFAGTVGVVELIKRLTRSPLTRNGYALIASAVSTSGLGVVFWVIAAHVITPTELGIGSVMISSLLTIGYVSQLNLGNLLNRFLPTAGRGQLRLIASTYAAAGTTAVILSTVFVLVADRALPELSGVTSNVWTGLLFVFGTLVWTIFALQDSVLAGLRRAVWVPIENTIYSTVKIIVLLMLAGAGIMSAGLFAAWTVPLLPIDIVINILILRSLATAHQSSAPAAENPLAWGTVFRFFRWDYVGSLMMIAAMGTAPIMVLTICGLEASASYHLCWTITYSLYLVSRSMGIALLTESVASKEKLGALAAAAIVQTLVPLSCAAGAIALGAPIVMSLFGSQYAAEASTLLSVLAISSIPWGLVTIFVAVARAQGWMAAIVASQAATLVITLGTAALLMPRMGVTGIGVGWLCAHLFVAVAIGAFCMHKFGRASASALLLQMASALAEFVEPFLPHRKSILVAAHDLDLDTTFAKLGFQTWQVGPVLSSQSDTTVAALNVPRSADSTLKPVAMLKLASSERGLAALRRGSDILGKLATDERFAQLAFAVPRLLASTAAHGEMLVVEEVLPGLDARAIYSLSGASREAAFDLAADALASLKNCTAVSAVIDEAWLDSWIDRPVELLRTGPGALLSAGQRELALNRLKAEQRNFWTGRTWMLGVAHGDLSPGNLIYLPDTEADGTPPKLRLSGIIDWSEYRDAAPVGFDACHLVATTRVLRRSQELGTVVRSFLAEPRWEADERRLLDRATGGAVDWSDMGQSATLVAFAWLQHLYCDLRKSDRYGSSYLWQTANVNWVLRWILDRQGL